MANIFDVGTVVIANKEINLFKFDRSEHLNIYPQVVGIEIYESLANYTITADIHISEGLDLINNFPLAGEEFIELTMQTPERKSITYKFFVESITDLKTNEMSNQRNYILRCVTEDYLKNSFTVFTKRYANMPYSHAVSQVITQDLGSSVGVNIEETKGTFDFMVNRVRPFQVIDLLCERAVSDRFKSSVFFFYQDNESYHFTTLEKLIDDRMPQVKNNDLTFVADTANQAEKYEDVVNVRNILSYNTIQQGSSVEKVKSGAMRMQVREFDILTGSYFTKHEYVNTTGFSEYKEIDEGNKFDFNSDAYNNFVTKKPGVTVMTVRDSTRPINKHNENIHLKRPYVDRLGQYTVNIKVYGDTSIRVGDVIKLDIPEVTGATDKSKQQIYSENYIIFELKHTLGQNETGNFVHTMAFHLKKPNLFGRAIG